MRVHSNRAAAAARSVNAAAFTVGHDVVFGAGSYAPETSNGQRLLAHELAHTIQQSQNPSLRRIIQRGTLAQFRTASKRLGRTTPQLSPRFLLTHDSFHSLIF